MPHEIAIIILTFNEELHIERAIRSAQQLSKAIYIVDSFSTDKTVEIAKSLGALVVQRAFTTQADQFNWALSSLELREPWIMRLDADEVIGSDLVENLLFEIQKAETGLNGFTINRRHIFLGKWIRHGGRYPICLLRVWRNGFAFVEDKWMDEHVVLTNGSSKLVAGLFEDRNLRNVGYFISKHNAYAAREAAERLRVLKDAEGNLSRNSPKQFIKVNVYNALPFGIGPILYFMYRMILLGGIFDGVEGLIYHGFQGLWYRVLVDVKIFEAKHYAAYGGELPDALRFMREIEGKSDA